MTGRFPITEIRRNLPALVHEAEQGRIVDLTQRGELVAVLVGHKQFGRLVSNRRGFIGNYRQFTQDVDLADPAFDPDELFAGTRETAPGRELQF